jgi:hypothetical protein
MDASAVAKVQASAIEQQNLESANEPLTHKLDALRRACVLAMQLVQARPNGLALLEWRDPLPESSVTALRRLRAEHRAKR